MFVNPLSADNRYSLLNRGNLLQHIKTQLLSQERKIFNEFFSVLIKFRFNFEHFEKKDDPHS